MNQEEGSKAPSVRQSNVYNSQCPLCCSGQQGGGWEREHCGGIYVLVLLGVFKESNGAIGTSRQKTDHESQSRGLFLEAQLMIYKSMIRSRLDCESLPCGILGEIIMSVLAHRNVVTPRG